MNELITNTMMLNILLMVLIVLGSILFICPKQKNSFINSIAVGFLLLLFTLPSWVIVMYTQLKTIESRYTYVLKKCYDENITLNKTYNDDIRDIKIQEFKEKL